MFAANKFIIKQTVNLKNARSIRAFPTNLNVDIVYGAARSKSQLKENQVVVQLRLGEYGEVRVLLSTQKYI